jgi:hypothetical protein
MKAQFGPNVHENLVFSLKINENQQKLKNLNYFDELISLFFIRKNRKSYNSDQSKTLEVPDRS